MKSKGQDPPAINLSVSSSSDEEEETEAEITTTDVQHGNPNEAGAQQHTTIVKNKIEQQDEEESDSDEDSSNDEDEEEDDSSEEDSDEDSSDEEDEKESKPKRVSFSKEMLKPTRQKSSSKKTKHTPAYVSSQLKPTGYGDQVKQGSDVLRDNRPPPKDPNANLGDFYKNTKMKSTGFAEKLKEGQDVPRDHIAAPVDPNSKLADMYKQHSTNFKATGFGDQLKEGKDVLRETRPPPVDPNANLGEMYKKTKMRSTGFGDKLKQGQDILAGSKTSTTAAKESNPFDQVKLKKSGKNPEDKSKNAKATGTSSTLASVKLQKTTPQVKEPTKFELPSEFAQARESLKRRTERPWYSQGVASTGQAKKWFFQRGEWQDPDQPTPTQKKSVSWFFGGGRKEKSVEPIHKTTHATESTVLYRGSKSIVTTSTKQKSGVNHYNVPSSSSNNTKSKGIKKPFNRNYYNEIQRRRGLAPKSSLRIKLFRGILLLFVILPFVLGSILYVVTVVKPELGKELQMHLSRACEGVEQALQPVKPHVDPVLNDLLSLFVHMGQMLAWLWQQVQPHIQPAVDSVRSGPATSLSTGWQKAKPHVDPIVQSMLPHVGVAISKACTPVENFVLDGTSHAWLTTIHKSVVASCSSARDRLDELKIYEDSIISPGASEIMTADQINKNARQSAITSKTHKQTRPVDTHAKLETQTAASKPSLDCVCDNEKKPKRGLKRLFGGMKMEAHDCCSKA